MRRLMLSKLVMLVAYILAFTTTAGLAASEGNEYGGSSVPLPPAATVNSASFVNVTQADGVFVQQPLVRSSNYDEEIASQNTARIKAIMNSPAISQYCRIYFPAGAYYFNGAATGWSASIQSTAKYQSFTGDGINATRLIQKSLDVPATIKLSHSNCTIQDLSIMSSDYQQDFSEDWDKHPHQTAIALESSAFTHTDPQILNVNINTSGNNIIIDGFFRPFKTGIKVTGPWFNVYAHTMFMLYVHNAIYVNQGNMCGGPAKFIDINAYATSPHTVEPVTQTWNTFFKSEGHFMEQVELIHCTYIGSQFIYMDGAKLSSGDDNYTKTATTPVYNMIVDHCYINSLWLPSPSEEAKWSGIYLNLPPRPGGIEPGFGTELYSRQLIFTNNTCMGKTPRNGAFFYIEGNVRNVTLQGNHIASGGGDRCIYLRATRPFINTDVALRDIKIADNYFEDFQAPITIGGNKQDPSRSKHNAGQDDDPYWVEGVTITGNRSYYLPVTEKYQLTGIFLNRVRRVLVQANTLAKTSGSSVIMNECEDIIMQDNMFAGLADMGENGIGLQKCKKAILIGNITRGFRHGILQQGSENVSLANNLE